MCLCRGGLRATRVRGQPEAVRGGAKMSSRMDTRPWLELMLDLGSRLIMLRRIKPPNLTLTMPNKCTDLSNPASEPQLSTDSDSLNPDCSDPHSREKSKTIKRFSTRVSQMPRSCDANALRRCVAAASRVGASRVWIRVA